MIVALIVFAWLVIGAACGIRAWTTTLDLELKPADIAFLCIAAILGPFALGLIVLCSDEDDDAQPRVLFKRRNGKK